jgi:hypothetical protein
VVQARSRIEGELPVADLTTTVDTHLAAYCEPDKATRDAAIAAVWAADGALVDPPLTGEGHAGISDLAAAVQSQFAGHTFRRVSDIDAHHDVLRYAWELVGPDGAVAVSGLDVALVGDGRLQRVVGFFGELAPAR